MRLVPQASASEPGSARKIQIKSEDSLKDLLFNIQLIT